jgi:hypothetical protein
MEHWSLFVDESGDFDDPEDDVVVAGLLLSEERHPRLARRLRRALDEAVPEVPWPIHARLTRQPVMFALWPYRRAAEDLEAVHPLVAAAIAAGRAEAGEALERALEALRQERAPAHEDLLALDRALARRAPAAHGYLLRRASATRAALARVAAWLAPEETSALAPAALFFPAGETIRGDAIPRDASGDRYLTVLEALFQRVADALLALGGSHQVNVCPLSRRVSIRDVPGARRDPFLRPEHIAGAMARVTSPERRLARGEAWVRLNPGPVPHFDESVHPALVIADFLSNLAYGMIPRHWPLARLLERLRDRVLLPVETRPGLPNPAASGRARALLDSVRGGRGEDPGSLDEPGVRPWAREQALLWKAAIEEAAR